MFLFLRENLITVRLWGGTVMGGTSVIEKNERKKLLVTTSRI